MRSTIDTTNDPLSPRAYDVVGVGFGPSNLALALTFQEEVETGRARPLRSIFLERRDRFIWHPHMLLDGAQIQISFLKDLVTMRNPRSRFSFLSYLHDTGRLADFVRMRNFFPARTEFNDYYQWAARQLDDHVRYQRQVLEITPVESPDGHIRHLRVVDEDVNSGERDEYLARNLVVGTGGLPIIPDGIELCDGKVFHNCEFLHHIRSGFPDRDHDYTFMVVGSGQSAAEIFQYLYENYPNAKVTAIMRRYAYKPADDSHFVNEIFFPSTVDLLYNLPAHEREKVITTHYDTNFSCVDLDLIDEIYAFLYAQKVAGESRAEIRNLVELRHIEDLEGGGVRTTVFDKRSQRTEELDADAVVLATGFYRQKQHPLLDSVAPYLHTNAAGGYDVSRRYWIESDEKLVSRVFLQGFAQDTHGISETLLSVLPARSLEILEELLATVPDSKAAA